MTTTPTTTTPTTTPQMITVPAGLTDARVLVTGGGTGIGRETALLFGRAGAKVAVLGRHHDSLDGVVAELQAQGVEAMSVVADIRDEASIDQAFDEIVGAWGGLDVLINNAGGQFPKMASDMSVNAWRAVVDLNLNGTFICSQAFARRAVAAGTPGRIVNVTTAAALRPTKGLSHSISSRFGVIAQTQALALEWAEHGITVNAIAPGMIRTSGFIEAELRGDSTTVDRLAEAVPLGRAGRPEEIAGVIAFLASPTCAYMTGETVLVDGGYVLGPGMHIDESGEF